MDKKAAELTMNVIIIAVLALVVLLVLLFVFKDQIGKAVFGYNRVQNNTNVCLDKPNDPECKNFLGIQTSPGT